MRIAKEDLLSNVEQILFFLVQKNSRARVESPISTGMHPSDRSAAGQITIRKLFSLLIPRKFAP
jgi:hypothetical protein